MNNQRPVFGMMERPYRAVPNPTPTQGLEAYRGVFKDGYTSEDVEDVLEDVSKLTGLNIVVVWEYLDSWGTGGNSDYAVVGPDDQLCECPDAIGLFLNSGEGDAGSLRGLAPGRLLTEQPERVRERNYAYTVDPTREIG